MHMNNGITQQVYDLLYDIDSFGLVSHPRGTTVKEVNLAELTIDPFFPIIDFEKRHFNYRYFAGEFAWYLKKDNRIDFINNFSSFWKGICPDGIANSNYGNLMFNFHPSSRSNDEVNELTWVYDSLMNDKNTRQAIAFYNSPFFQYKGNKDFVCTMYMNFWIRNDYLDMKVQMRSNDIFFGLTYDAPWFSMIQQNMLWCLRKKYPELKLGIYHHCADNIHYYDRHFDMVEEILDSSVPEESIKFELKSPFFDFMEENGKTSIFLTDDAYRFINEVEDELNSSDKDWKGLVERFFVVSDIKS